MQGADVAVDVGAVGPHADRRHLRAELLEDERRDAVGRAVGGVDHDLDAVEREVPREGRLGEDHVAAARVLELLGAADRLAGLAHRQGALFEQRLDLGLGLVGELEAVGAEDLDAVVVVRIVAGADHDAGVGAHADREVRDRGRRDRAAQDHAAAHRADPRGERRLDHVAREPRVLADHDARDVALAAARDERDRAAQLERELGRHGRLVRDAADPVGSEEVSHLSLPISLTTAVTRTRGSPCNRSSGSSRPTFTRSVTAHGRRRGRSAP